MSFSRAISLFSWRASNQVPLRTMSKTALILATEGTEDIELSVTSNILRRANVQVTIAGLKSSDILTLSQKIKIQPDKKLSEILNDNFDAVVLPGGPGHKEYSDKNVGEILKRHESNGKILAAVCAGPLGFKYHNIAHGTTVTSYPSVKDELVAAGYKFSEENVVVSNSGSATIVTSRGPGTTFEFALKIVELLAGDEVASNVRKAVLL